jgi:hypothetical protein
MPGATSCEDDRGWQKRLRGDTSSSGLNQASQMQASCTGYKSVADGVGLTPAALDALQVTVGVNERLSLRSAVKTLVHGTVCRHKHLLMPETIQRMLQRTIVTQDKMLQGLTASAQARSSNKARNCPIQGLQDDQRPPVGADWSQPNRQQANSPHGGPKTSWAVEYQQGCVQHVVGTILLVRQELVDITQQLPTMVIFWLLATETCCGVEVAHPGEWMCSLALQCTG